MSEFIQNQDQRVETLKNIIRHLHEGRPAAEVKNDLVQIVKQTDHAEIVCMEQKLMDEGMPVEQVRSMCDLHSQVTREILVQPARAVPPGHPADTFRRENQAIADVLTTMRAVMREISDADDAADVSSQLLRWRQCANDLMDIDKHYQRKEHALFSCLERHGINGPSKVMWAKDDEVRAFIKQLISALRHNAVDAAEWKPVVATLGEAVASSVQEMIYKENHILLPMSLDKLTDDEWAEIWAVSPRYGWCLVEPQEGYKPENTEAIAASNRGVMLPTGNLAIDQLVAMFNHLPVDITYVDADDRVAFFSEGPSRVFARSKAIIGRKVQNCHPPKSVSTVDRILEDFRSGSQSLAEFWLTFHGRFVHVRYFAIRDAAGAYMGTLEVTQDCTHIRALEGERRLLQYDSDPVTA